MALIATAILAALFLFAPSALAAGDAGLMPGGIVSPTAQGEGDATNSSTQGGTNLTAGDTAGPTAQGDADKAGDSPLSQALAPTMGASSLEAQREADILNLTVQAEETFIEAIAFEPADGSGATQVDCRFDIIEGSLVEVCGSGTLAGFRAVDIDLAGKLTIPPTIVHDGSTYTVVRIGDYAFGGTRVNSCAALTEVTIPQTVKTIGEYAFANCEGLETLALPSGLSTIGHHAFYYCTGLAEVRIPASVTSMGDYSFCQSSGLKTVTFEGDATVTGEYSFTGSTTIEKVVFLGKALPYDTIGKKDNGYFNNATVDRPAYYYAISFYATMEDKVFDTNRIGFAVVSEKTKFKDICEGLDAAGGLYEGAVPAWPQGTNLWRFDGVTQMADTPTDSTAAYPVSSAYRNLARGSVTMSNVSYTGEPLDPIEKCYRKHPQKPDTWILVQPNRTMSVCDLNGTELDPGVDFTATYYRQNGAGSWAPTDDLVSPGEIRAVLAGAGHYNGEMSTTFKIEFDTGCTFVTDIPVGDGTDRTVRCAFRVDSLTDDGGTVSVAPKEQTKREEADGKTQRAVPLDTRGELAIPASIKVLGRTFEVTGIASEAFGSSREATCNNLTAITFPPSINSIGAYAFNGCGSLAKLVFEGSVYPTRFGTRAFASCPLRQVVFFGKKPNDSRYSMSTLFPSNPDFFYTLKFYGSKAAYEAGADPLGSITLRDDFKLSGVPDKPTDPQYVYTGSVPDYPTYYIDDHGNEKRHWYAPAWFYAEADDNRVALMNPLEDSTYAYAVQMQDAFAIDDAIVYGMQDSYDYTGGPVVTANDLTVCSGLGGTLTRGVDYEVTFERIDDELNWAATDNLVSGGELRVVINGVADYVTETRPLTKTFKIVTYQSRVGTIFTYEVPLTANGEEGATECRFIVTSLGEGRSCSVHPETSNSPAVARGASCDRVIPEYVECMGVPYRVTAVEERAFASCSYLTGIQLPPSVAEIGPSTFYYCQSLVSIELPEGIQAIPESTFTQCDSLRSVTLPEGVKSIGNYGFYYCRSLEDINLPDSLEEIGYYAFASCSSLNALTVPANLAATSTAFANTGVRKLSFGEGTQTIVAGAFSGCRRLESVELPNTVMQIGSNAFSSSAIKRLKIPASVATLSSRAFGSCAALTEIIFEGNASAIDMEGAFASDGALASVVFRGTPPHSIEAAFPAAGSSCRYYSDIRFYESPEALAAGTPSGVAAVQHGVRLRSVKAGALTEDQVFDGAVPALPEGATCWSFDGGVALSETVSRSMDAVATAADPTDLSAGYIVTSVSYRYTSSTIDPFAAGSAAGTGFVMTATGDYLTRGVHFTLQYQRKNASGEWVESANKASRGTIRVVATAVPGSGYTGSVAGYYSIADYLPGDTFTADDGNGHLVTYKVLEPGTSMTPGKACVGTGGTANEYQNAVSDDSRGAIALPDVVQDPRGNLFEVTEIAPYAFYRCMGITEVTVPAGVCYVGSKAFAYERIKTDVRTSNIARVNFNNDMTETLIASDAFLGCDMISTVVYGQKKGVFEEIHPFQLVPGVRLTRYYTARFYPSLDDLRAGRDIVATVVVKEGTYLYSPSLSDYLAGSDRIPFPDETHEWAYDEASCDEDGRLVNSMGVYGYEVVDNTIIVDVPVEAAGVTASVPCAFTVLAEPSGEGDAVVNGRVSVGTMRDGHPCVEATVTGRLIIPETVEYLGARYDVVEIGAYAFGSSDETADVARITSVSVPASVAGIEQAAFMNCASLEAVDFLDGSRLATVGAAAFLGCKSLDHIELPASVTAVRTAAFELTGLRRVVLPSGLTALNRRAFNDCAHLREVVFAGPSHLDLPVLPGFRNLPAYSYPEAPAKLALASVDDYAFAGCTVLERVVFEADADELVVSEVAFSDCEGLAAVVFGGAACDAAPFAVDEAHAPTVYYTITYNDDETGSGRLGYLCVPAGIVYSAFDKAGAYAGAEPELPEHHEWVAAFDVDAPLADSSTFGMRRIRYAIATDGNDASVLIGITVAGAPATEAALDDEVSVSVSAESGVEPTGFSVLDAATGQKIAVCTTPEGTFTMPGAPVSIRASYKLDMTIVAQRAFFGEASEERTLTLDEVRDAAAKANPKGEVRRYSAWDLYREPQITVAEEWIGLPELVAAAGFRFDAEDSLIVETADGRRASISYNDLYPEVEGSYDRRYYPGILTDEQEGAEAVLPCIAIRSASYSPASQAAPAGTSLADCYKLCYGQRPREFSNIVNTFSSQPANVVRITVLYGPEDVTGCQAKGLPVGGYYYTGARIMPKPVVYDVDGRVMRANVDYDISYGANIEAGAGTFTISGLGLYKGKKQFTFNIRRADLIGGGDKAAMTAAVALDAYPQGSKGAVVVASKNYNVALSAAVLAGALDYPVLLTGKNSLSPYTADALSALRFSDDFEIIVVGEKKSAGKKLRNALKRYVPNANYIQALVGKDRYAVSTAVYDYGRDLRLWSSKVIVASGKGFANVVSILPYAVANRCPILLAKGKKTPKPLIKGAKKKIIKSVLIMGGKKVVKKAVAKRAKKLVGKSNVKRLKGTNRYAVCASINALALRSGSKLNGAVISSGASSPSAMAGAVLAAKRRSVLLLAQPSDMRTLGVLAGGKSSVLRISFVGRASDIPASVRSKAIAYLGWSKEALR